MGSQRRSRSEHLHGKSWWQRWEIDYIKGIGQRNKENRSQVSYCHRTILQIWEESRQNELWYWTRNKCIIYAHGFQYVDLEININLNINMWVCMWYECMLQIIYINSLALGTERTREQQHPCNHKHPQVLSSKYQFLLKGMRASWRMADSRANSGKEDDDPETIHTKQQGWEG